MPLLPITFRQVCRNTLLLPNAYIEKTYPPRLCQNGISAGLPQRQNWLEQKVTPLTCSVRTLCWNSLCQYWAYCRLCTTGQGTTTKILDRFGEVFEGLVT